MLAGGKVAAGLAQGGADFGAGHSPGGRKSGEQGTEEDAGGGEEESSRVEMKIAALQQGRGADFGEKHQGEKRDGDSGGASGCGQYQAFGEELANEAEARGSEGDADGDFLAAGGGAGEQQIGDVGAGHQQDESDGAQDNHHCGAKAAGDLQSEWAGSQGESTVGLRVLNSEDGSEAVDFVIGFLGRDAGSEAADEF